jgi:hypothetical protein
LAKFEKKNGLGNLVDHSYFGYGKTGSEFKKQREKKKNDEPE